MKNIFFALLIGCTQLIYAQESASPLIRGGKVPDFDLKILNYTDPIVKITDYKGKLVVLGFWATWCGSCISNFPKLEALQNEFKDQIQIILINSREPQEKVLSFLDMRESVGMKISLPIAADNVTARHLFPYQFIPHYVWIDQSGKFSAITSSEFMTVGTIRQLLRDKN